MTAIGDLDLSVPTLAGAYFLAHQEAQRAGKEAAAALMAKLLVQVDVEAGGLLGADDWRVAMVRRRYGISVEQYIDALYSAGSWPTTETTTRDAA